MADHAKSTNPAVQAQLDRLTMLSPGRDVLGLERITALLDRLGNPHHNLPPTFHVAGTNGKGSTCAFLRGAIEAAELTAHVYSSPHLVRFNERIRVAGKLIEDEALAAVLAEVLDHADGLEASFFEVTTAAAFLAFARTPADACIVEVGLGGRLDATNVLAAPVACGVASLGIDHEAFLLAPEDGAPETPLDRIAFEKAGIAKPGVPLITQKYVPSMTDTIATQAKRAGAPLLARGEAWDFVRVDGRMLYRDGFGELNLPLPRMAGSHQADNAALAVAMLRHQNAVSIPDPALSAAMERTDWPARMQLLGKGPLTDLLPDGSQIWLDGGHNPDAGMAISKHFDNENKRLHVIIGMLANKNPLAIIGPLGDKVASITVLPVQGHEYHGVEAFAKALNPRLHEGADPNPELSWEPNGKGLDSRLRGNDEILEVLQAPDILAALDRLRINPLSEAVLIVGSLYLSGEVLKANNQVPN